MKLAKLVRAAMIFSLLTAGPFPVRGDQGTPGQTPAEHRRIAPAEAKARLEKEPGVILLDVRTPEEYAMEHIPGSRLIPVDQLEAEAVKQLPDKNGVIIVHCQSGRRSGRAYEILVKLGYSQVYDLGGIVDWPYEKVTGDSK